MKYKLKRFSNTILKDFPQEEIHRFMNYCGTELYDKSKERSVNDINSSKIKRGKYNKTELEKYIKSETINFRANNRVYKASDFLSTWTGKEKLDKEYDILVDMSNGFIIPDNGDIYISMLGILPKYHNKNSTWEYVFINPRNSYPKPILTIPNTKEELKNIVKIFCELAVFLKVFTGCYYKFYFTDKNNKQKIFSDAKIPSLQSFIPTFLNTGYILVGYPLIMGRLSKKITEISKREYSKSKFDRFLDYCKKITKGNVYFVDLGPMSCYINPQMIEKNKLDKLKKEADSTRLRTMLDWILKAYEDKKHVIFYSDLDNPIALAHEVGHYLEDADGTLGKIQRGSTNRDIFSNGFVGFLSFTLGLFGSIGEIIGILSGLLLKSPLLFTELMASYKGLELIKDSKIFTEDEIQSAKKFFKLAWKTHFHSNYKYVAASSVGRLVGEGYRAKKRLKKIK